ncbi:hypothetical protein BGS_0639 [Beggiatoa sp. SS]|nr:hypothetical protein BGS_0639 [Beggiatoa sp. SS]
MPTYPFERQKYWIDAPQQAKKWGKSPTAAQSQENKRIKATGYLNPFGQKSPLPGWDVGKHCQTLVTI